MIQELLGMFGRGAFPYDAAEAGRRDYDTFISYTSSDVLRVRVVMEQLLAAGYLPWFAEYCIGSNKWSDDDDEIERLLEVGMDRSKSGVVFSSDAYAASPWCHYELDSIIDSCIELECSPISDDGSGGAVLSVPDLGEEIEDITITELFVSEGDEVEARQPVMEIEFDKASMELRVETGGVVEEIYVEKGETIGVGSDLLFVQSARPYARKVQELLSRIPPEHKSGAISTEWTLDFISHSFGWKPLAMPPVNRPPEVFDFSECMGWRLNLGGWRHVGEMESPYGSFGPIFERAYNNIPAKLNIAAGPVKGETLQMSEGEIDDRTYQKRMIAFVKEYGEATRMKIRGVHLIHVGGRGHFAATYGRGSTWIRKYSLNFPMPKDIGKFKAGDTFEFVLTFSIKGSFRDFCSYA